MSILQLNGGCALAMSGKNCFAIACDQRFGMRNQTIATDFERVYEIGPHLYVALPGLATDTQTFLQRLKFRVKMYEMRENRAVQPATLASMIKNMLYERRFGPYFVEPIVAGMDPSTGKQYFAAFDLIGAMTKTSDFAVSGTCDESLYGMCETLWRPNLSSEDLFESISQALLSSLDRDSSSGWGAVVHLVETGKVTTRYLKARQD